MKLFKILTKSICLIVGLIVFVVLVALMGESYKVVSKTNQGTDTKVEVKSFFGKNLSAATINSRGLYNGEFQSWHLFRRNLKKSEGQFKDGFWHGKWKEYNRDGSLSMIREWEKGKLIKLFVSENGEIQEISKDKWPEYANVQQAKPVKARKY